MNGMAFEGMGLQDGVCWCGLDARDIPRGTAFIPTDFGLLLHARVRQETLWCAGGSRATGEA
jgi:hypothetical protein